MADDKKTDEGKPAAGRSVESAARPAPKPAPSAPRQSRREEEAEAIRQLGGVTDKAADEYAAAGVNPKLDNRTGDQRPQAQSPKPQQVGS